MKKLLTILVCSVFVAGLCDTSEAVQNFTLTANGAHALRARWEVPSTLVIYRGFLEDYKALTIPPLVQEQEVTGLLPNTTYTATLNIPGGAGGSIQGTTAVEEAGKEQTTWRSVGSAPLSDAEAAAAVHHVAEVVTGNKEATEYVPTKAEVETFHTEVAGEEGGWNGKAKNVDGLDGLTKPSTDDLIQWAAAKWGIPADWLRAQYEQESEWKYNATGDQRATTSEHEYNENPPLSKQGLSYPNVWQSLGIPQVKWRPNDSSSGREQPGTEPLRWKSIAFAADYQAMIVRWYFDGDCSWCNGNGKYTSGQEWNSLAAWFTPTPWGEADKGYREAVETHLKNRDWPHP